MFRLCFLGGNEACRGSVDWSAEGDEGKEGEAVDVKATIKVIEKYLNDGWQGEDGTITAKSKMTKPEIQASDLKELSDVLGTFQTYYGDDGSSKAINVEAGANHIGG